MAGPTLITANPPLAGGSKAVSQLSGWGPCLSIIGSLFLLSACGTGGPDAPFVPPQGYYKVGKPYDGVDGRTYVPQEVGSYEATGMASWYGPGFHGKRTANGEPFDTNAMTAAHRTLPLPSVIKVTNVETGKTAILKVNDRGPFNKDRLIDMSKNAAQQLGIFGPGTGRVHVEYLPVESAYAAGAAKDGRIMNVDEAVQLAQGRRDNQTQLANAAPTANTAEAPIVIASTPLGSVQTETIASTTTAITATDLPPVTIPAEPVQPGHVELAAYTPPPTPLATTHTVTTTTTSFVPPPAGRGYFVQAGSFANPGNAEHLRQQLQSVGKSEIDTVQLNGKTLYRVRLGPLPDVSQANAVADKLGSFGVTAPKVIAD